VLKCQNRFLNIVCELCATGVQFNGFKISFCAAAEAALAHAVNIRPICLSMGEDLAANSPRAYGAGAVAYLLLKK